VIRRPTLALVLGCAIATGVAPAVAAAQPRGVALVLEVGGAITPPLQLHSEIPEGTAVSLAADARLLFLHYETCRAVAVVGGTLTVKAEDYALSGGRTESEIRRTCPRRVTVRGSGGVGGITMRALAPPPALALPVRPSFVVVGARANDFARARISRGGEPVAEVGLEHRSFRWPADARPLEPNAEYELSLLPATGSPVRIRFRAVRTDPPPDVPILIAVE
jgi:hypothetical protein